MYRISVLLILCFSFSFSFAQQNELQKIVTSQEKSQLLAEEVFVHTDKDFHIAGEVLWFKIYVLNKAEHKLQNISKIAYAELIDAQNVSKEQFKIALDDGMGSGSFHIPFSFPSGIYRLRVYTNWMKNHPTSFFEKEITIVNTTQTLDTSAFKTSSASAINFYPEGGQFVNGIENNVVFQFPQQKDFTGVIVDEVNDTILQFKPEVAGVGHFSLVPQNGKTYYAIVPANDGEEIKMELPKAVSSGYALQLTDNNDLINVSVKTSAVNDPYLFVVVSKGGKISYASHQKVLNNLASFEIQSQVLPSGLSSITIYNSKQQQIAERMYFKNAPLLNMSLQADKKDYATRSPVSIDIQIDDSTVSHLSASVYHLNDFNYPTDRSIVQSIIPKLVQNKKNAELLNHPELWNKYLLVTNNRDFTNKTDFTYVPEMEGNLIIVTVADNQTGEHMADVPVYLSLLGKVTEMQHALSDKKGNVYFNLKNIYGPQQLVLQTTADLENKVFLNIQKSFPIEQNEASTISVPLNESLRETLESLNNHMQVNERFSGNRLDSFVTRYSDSLSFYGKPGKTYMLDDYKRFVTMEEVLREYVQEVNVRIKGKKYNLPTLNEQLFDLKRYMSIEVMMKGDPLIFLDGVPVFDVNKIMKYDPLKVRKLEVVTNRYHVGPQAWDGILSFTTYHGNLEGFQLDPKVVVVDYDGLQNERMFYSPDYSNNNLRTNRIPDFREELYWQPSITTGKDGKANISFYTGDLKGEFIVVVQGVSDDGKPAYQQLQFEVK